MTIILYSLYLAVNLLMITIIVYFSGVSTGASNFVSSMTDVVVGSSKSLSFSRLVVTTLFVVNILMSLLFMRINQKLIAEREQLILLYEQIQTPTGTINTDDTHEIVEIASDIGDTIDTITDVVDALSIVRVLSHNVIKYLH